MRSTSALVLILLGGCWNGKEARHKPCADDDQCGRGQKCNSGFCDGPPGDTTLAGTTSGSTTSGSTTSGSTTSGGEDCGLPLPTTCDPEKRVMMRSLVMRELPSDDFSAPTAVAAGHFNSDAQIDLAVLSFGYRFDVAVDIGDMYESLLPYSPPANDLYDAIAVDLDADDETEFLVLSGAGSVEVLDWDGETRAITLITTLSLPPNLFSLTAVDLLGDDLPEILVSGSDGLYLFPNTGGPFVSGTHTFLNWELHEPWDTLVVGTGANTRIIVPVSNDMSTGGARLEKVELFALEGDTPVFSATLAQDFYNPWAVAEGDFLGGDELEIAVADRRLNGAPGTHDTTLPGLLRFFRVDGDTVTEVGTEIAIGIGPATLAAADLDCDGKTDLAIGNYGGLGDRDGAPQVLFGTCDSSASADNLMTAPMLGDTGVVAGSRMAVADFDGDGLLEVAIPDEGDVLDDNEFGTRVVVLAVQEAL